jgi:phosphate transport system substrate-binding protein
MFKKRFFLFLILNIICTFNISLSDEKNLNSSISNENINNNRILRIAIEPILLNLMSKFSDNFTHQISYLKINNINERYDSIRKICQNEDISFLIVTKSLNEYEKFLCSRYNNSELLEEKIGYYGFVFVTSNSEDLIELTSSTIFKALSIHSIKNIADRNEQYQSWKEIHKSFPDQKIQIYGPFMELPEFEFLLKSLVITQCMSNPYNQDNFSDFFQLEKFCREIKKDGTYSGESLDGRIILEKILNEKNAFGIVPYHIYERNKDSFFLKRFDGVTPSQDNILNNRYSLSYPIFIYYKKGVSNSMINDFLKEIKNSYIIGENGLLANHGLISLKN